MIKQVTNRRGVTIDINRVVEGNGSVYRNQATNEIKSGTTMLVKFSGITLGNIKRIGNAKLLLPCVGSGTFEVGVFRNTQDYNVSTVNGNNEPAYDTETYVHYEKFTIGNGSNLEQKTLEIDLTSLFTRWKRENASNLSFTIRCISTAGLTVYGLTHPDLADKKLFVLTHTDIDAYSAIFDYVRDEVPYGGVSVINTISGRLAHQLDVYQTESKQMPINFAVYYIERLSGIGMKNSLIGHWRSSFDYGFRIETDEITIVTPEGSISIFEKITREEAASRYEIVLHDSAYCFINLIDNSYIVEDYFDNGYQTYLLYDASKTRLRFNENNNILSILKQDGTVLVFNYNNSNLLTSVTSGDDYRVEITYISGTSRVQYVYFVKENRRIVVSYNTTSGNQGIAAIELQKGISGAMYTGIPSAFESLMITSFTHSAGRLTSVTNEKTKEGLLFTYNGEKVIKITNRYKNGVNFDITGYRDLEYFTDYTKVADFEGNIEYLTHDAFGMLHQTIDNEGNSSSQRHQSVGSDEVARGLAKTSGIIPVAKGVLADHSFEILGVEGITNNRLGWKTNNAGAVSSGEDGVYGRHCLSIKKTTNALAQVYQEISAANGIYNLECFVKTKAILGNAKITAQFQGYHYRQSGKFSVIERATVNFDSINITAAHTKWTKIVISNIIVDDYYNDGNAKLKIIIDGAHTGGELLVDDIRMNGETLTVNRNLLLGADMEGETGVPSGFVKSTNCSATDSIVTGSESAPYSKIIGYMKFRFDTAKDITKYIERDLEISGASGEAMTFAFWGKSDFNNGSSLKGKVIFKKGNTTVQTVESAADKTVFNWQLVSTTLNTIRPYDSVKIMIEYTGVNQCYIDGISLFRDNFGTSYKYNEKGNLLEAAQGEASKSYKTDGAKIVESVDESGEQYDYSYDGYGRVSKIKDARGNFIDLTYDSNGNRTSTKITSDNKSLEFKNTFNQAIDLVTSSLDELGNETGYRYDSAKRLESKLEANGLITTYSYDDFNNLTAILKSKPGISMGATYQYNANNTLKLIRCENGTEYSFIYDSLNRVTQINLNSQVFVTYVYGMIKNGITTDNITKQTVGSDVYDFSYDAKLRLTQVKLNNTIIVSYEYNSDSNIAKKVSGTKVSYYDYDTSGKIIRETRENGDSLIYDYDNLGQLQKSIMDISGMQRSYDFEYLNEYNEYNAKSFKERIDRAYGDDIIDFNALNSGLYGAKAESVWGTKVTYNDKQLFRLSKMTSKIIYPLDTVNSKRQTLASGGVFDRGAFNRKYAMDKTIFGWFRFSGSINTTAATAHKVFGYSDDKPTTTSATADLYSVNMYKSSSNLVFRLMRGTTLLASRTIPASNDFIFIGLKLGIGIVSTDTFYTFTVNNQTITGNTTVSSSQTVESITRFILGNRNITVGSMMANPFIQDVAMISLGAYNYTNDDFQKIRYQETRYDNINLKPKTGVSFINQRAYGGFEVMTLNGTFKSTNNRAPLEYEFIDGTYKMDKTKLFKYDEGLERHVYGSYSAAQGLGIVKGLLVYKHDLKAEGTVAINFKIEENGSLMKTVLEFKEDNFTKLAVKRNELGKLVIVENGYQHVSNITIPVNEWCRILVTYSGQSITVFMNSALQSFNVAEYVDLSNTKLYIGSSVDTTKKPVEHLDGVLEMLAMYPYLVGYQDEIDNIVCREQQLSVKTEVDLMGRSKRDIIDTGFVTSLGQGTTRKLISEYEYKEPGVGKTSLQVSKVQGFDGIERNYTYDNMGNITRIVGSGINLEYQYDELSRLVTEVDYNLDKAKVYTYVQNNNISRVEHYTVSGVLEKIETYNYDVSYKDKLLSMSTLQNGVTTTKTITYNNNNVASNFLGNTLTWQGRRLVGLNSNISYEYNESGIRTSKTVNGSTTNYHLVGDKVAAMSRGSEKLFFHYNERNLLVGFEYAGNNYFYHRDLTGVITSIVDITGSIVVKYLYDAWGNWLNKTTAAQTTIGQVLVNLNPFIYKGYIFDEESGFYYLKSRYYSPEVRRFINVDSRISKVGELDELNLFAYSLNNPVMFSDPNGTFAILQYLFSLVCYAGMAACAVVDLISNGGQGAWKDMNDINWNPFNSDESVVLASKHISFYKGVPVFMKDSGRSGSFFAIFLNKNIADADTIRHEWGHNVQLMIMGPVKYGLMIGLPSYFKWGKHKWGDEDYYIRPWEAGADMFGGVAPRSGYYTARTAADEHRAMWYLLVSTLFGSFGYLFLI